MPPQQAVTQSLLDSSTRRGSPEAANGHVSAGPSKCRREQLDVPPGWTSASRSRPSTNGRTSAHCSIA
ncbi:hypothetical protein ACM614_26355 [Streptomyces sp. 12297]